MDLIERIRLRSKKRTEFGYGILTADKYVRTVAECVDNEHCDRLYGETVKNVDELIKLASQKLVYSNPDMVTELTYDKDAIKQNTADFRELLSDDTEIPKNTLMVVRHVLTTPRKDRDGDRLRTQGAQVDPKMLMLWQHIHTLPIGKLLEVVEHSSQVLRNVSAIVDNLQLAQDAAVMIDNGMGRYSHGFRAIEWDRLKEDEGDTTGGEGFDVKTFEIMEQSLVSVPSNIDAETEDILMSLHDRKQVKSEIVRDFIQKRVKDKRNLSTPGVDVPAQLTLKFAGAEIEINQAKPPCQSTKATSETDEGSTKNQDQPSDEKRVAPGSLDGSFEWTQEKLRSRAKSFLDAAVVDITNRFVWIVGTYPDNAIICAEHERSGVPDEFLYYKADWTVKDGEPVFQGEASQVELSVSVDEMRERSPIRITAKGIKYQVIKGIPTNLSDEAIVILADEKSGRVLSRANLQKLKDVRDDLEELAEGENLQRGQRALCRGCMAKLSQVISTQEQEESSTEPDDVATMRSILADLTDIDSAELAEHAGKVRAILSIAERSQRTKEVTRLLAS